MNIKNQSYSFVGLLQIAFIILKLCGVISCSWWCVLSPTWIYLLFIISISLFVVIVHKVRITRLGLKKKKIKRRDIYDSK